MGRPGWTAEIEVDADLGKIPNDPVEAAKYAVDQVRRLASPFVTVEHHRDDGSVMNWMVDTSTGEVTDVGVTTSGMTAEQREDYIANQTESPCCWIPASEHAVEVWVLHFSSDPDDWTLGCTTHLGHLMSDEGANVTPYNENGE